MIIPQNTKVFKLDLGDVVNHLADDAHDIYVELDRENWVWDGMELKIPIIKDDR